MAGLGQVVAWACLHVAIGVSGTWVARRYALSRNLLDQPGERRSHAVATPRGAGIAIVASALLALAWLGFGDLVAIRTIAMIAIGLVLVAGIGWVDDHRALSPWPRLAVQLVSAILVAIALITEGQGADRAIWGFVVVMVLVNVWNFMDGIDGLAASQAMLVASGWLCLAWPEPWAWLLLAMAAACFGFLPFNLPRARIFLGDIGSGALGYLLAVGLLWLPANALQWPWLAWLPLSAFLVDASLTLAMRILRGERWWTPHLQHAYQRWAAKRGGHGGVTVAYALWTAGTVLIMVMAQGVGTRKGAILMISVYAVAMLAWVRLRRDRPIRVGSREQ